MFRSCFSFFVQLSIQNRKPIHWTLSISYQIKKQRERFVIDLVPIDQCPTCNMQSSNTLWFEPIDRLDLALRLIRHEHLHTLISKLWSEGSRNGRIFSSAALVHEYDFLVIAMTWTNMASRWMMNPSLPSSAQNEGKMLTKSTTDLSCCKTTSR